MQRRFTSPQLHRSKITLGREIGIGQNKNFAKPVKRAAIKDPTGKKFFAAAKQIPKHFEKLPPAYQREKTALAQRAYRTFKRAGLPVPSFSRAFLLKNNLNYLTLFMEDMERKVGKLEDGHTSGHPEFLKRLTLKNNSNLIRNLASDLTTIHNLGFTSDYLDFWHFYKKPSGEYERVILDFHSFKNKYSSLDLASSFSEKLFRVKQNLGKKEFEVFLEEAKKKFNGPKEDWKFILDLLSARGSTFF